MIFFEKFRENFIFHDTRAHGGCNAKNHIKKAPKPSDYNYQEVSHIFSEVSSFGDPGRDLGSSQLMEISFKSRIRVNTFSTILLQKLTESTESLQHHIQDVTPGPIALGSCY